METAPAKSDDRAFFSVIRLDITMYKIISRPNIPKIMHVNQFVVSVFMPIAVLWFSVIFIACISDSSDGQSTSPGLDDDSMQAECLPEDFDYPYDIDVLRTATGEVVTLDLEDYIKGVIIAEMGSGFPKEALKAQAIAARTYAVHWVQYKNEPICDTTSCQVYVDKRDDITNAAVDATQGIILLYEENVIEAVFHASCGGYTLSNNDVWGTDPLPYLQGVSCLENAYCTDDCSDWSLEVESPCECQDDNPPCIDSYGKTCCWGVFGHRVGMCQRGAQAMALCGYSASQIVGHYYQGVSLHKGCQ